MAVMIEQVVLIDDNVDDSYFIRRRLEKAKLARNIMEFEAAEEALSYLRAPDRARVGLILLDINMPRMDGFEFADRYDQLYDELKADTLLLMISASLNPDDERRASDHPAIDGFVAKPACSDDLKKIVATCMAGS